MRSVVEKNPAALGLSFLQSQLGAGDVASALLSTPGAFATLDEQRAAEQGVIGDSARDEINGDGVLALRLWPHSTDILMSKTRIAKIDDFEGIKAVTADPFSVAVVRELGGNPLRLPFAELYTGMRTGVADTAVISQSSNREDFIDLFGGGTVVPEYKFRTGVTLVSSDWWEELTAKEQRQLLAALDQAETAATAALHDETVVNLKQSEERGIKVVTWQTFPEADVRRAVSASIQSTAREDAEPILQLREDLNSLRRGRTDDMPDGEQKGSDETQARVFFASNRRFDGGETALSDRFANTEDPGNTIRCGELASAGPGLVGEVSEDVALAAGTSVTEGDDCISLIASATGDAGGTLLIYIHGYRNSFEDAAKTGLAFARDAGRDGVVLVWTWPSGAALASYQFDEESVVISEPPFLSLVHGLAASDSVSQIDFLAHSMGSRLAAKLMRDSWIDAPSAVVVAAADVSRPFLKQAVDEATSASVSLLATDGDLALWASRKLHQRPRAGRARPIFLLKGMDTIDLSAFDRRWSINHGHAFSEPEVVDDLGKLFRGEWSAASRGLGRRHSANSDIDFFAIVPRGN